MPSTALDSAVFRDLFSAEPMRRVFSDESRLQKYLDVEAALARVQARLGIIPAEAAEEIEKQAKVEKLDLAKLKQRTDTIGYPVLPVVEQLTALCANNYGQWAHWGATTQDITDTATVLQIREALSLIEADLTAVCELFSGLAKRYRNTPMAGRSNLQQAIPITFGFKMAELLATFRRHRVRLLQLRPRVLMGEFGGAAGTLASLGDRGLEVQSGLMRELGLEQPEIAWHTLRDSIAETGCFLGLITGTLAKLATDIKLLMQTEVGEVFEPFASGRGSSSTMPQKRNPISCVFISACAASVRHNAAALLEAMAADHERSTGPWEIEWIALPEAFLLTSGALAHAKQMLEGLEVNEARMRENLKLTNGLITSEAVMMGLAPYIGRERAHDLVYAICREAIKSGKPLADLICESAEISRHLDRSAIIRLADPANYLGLAREMVDRVLAQEKLDC